MKSLLRSLKIVESTLREGEQFQNAFFKPKERLYIAKLLDKIGVDCIELANPAISQQAKIDCENIFNAKIKAKIFVHCRCTKSDIDAALSCKIDGINLFLATSPILAKYSHGKGIDEVSTIACELIQYIKNANKNLEIRFSCEDTFRSNLEDVISIYNKVSHIGVDRVGIADTVGVAFPSSVFEVVKSVKNNINPKTEIEVHFHNDVGNANANAISALEAGATYIDTSVLGIGERNGITQLGSLLAQSYIIDKEYTKQKYNLKLLAPIERYIAHVCDIQIPFNNCLTGSSAFSHKAGVHTKAVLNNASSYEAIDPADFGCERSININNRLTGWNAVGERVNKLGLNLSTETIKIITQTIKSMSDVQTLTNNDIDRIITSYCI
jgi:homocitrate synthase